MEEHLFPGQEYVTGNVFLLLKTGILGGMDVNGCLSAVTILSICEHLQGCIGKH